MSWQEMKTVVQFTPNCVVNWNRVREILPGTSRPSPRLRFCARQKLFVVSNTTLGETSYVQPHFFFLTSKKTSSFSLTPGPCTESITKATIVALTKLPSANRLWQHQCHAWWHTYAVHMLHPSLVVHGSVWPASDFGTECDWSDPTVPIEDLPHCTRVCKLVSQEVQGLKFTHCTWYPKMQMHCRCRWADMVNTSQDKEMGSTINNEWEQVLQHTAHTQFSINLLVWGSLRSSRLLL